jgi:pimeloyl-ACP methyl ester carboxylesterase
MRTSQSGFRPQSAEVRVDGKRLEVATFEPATAPLEQPIVVLHEGLGSVAMWKTFPQLLAERTARRVVAYSRYGYGDSDELGEPREPGYMHHEARVVLPELLSALEISAPILFGHSDGASIALLYAGMFPSAATALVLEAPHVFVEDHSIAGISAAARAFRETGLAGKLARYHRDVQKTFAGWNDVWLDPRFRAWNIEEFLPRIRCPVLALQGLEDDYGTAAQLYAIAAAVPQATVAFFEDCGHAPHRDRPEQTLDATALFLARLGS